MKTLEQHASQLQLLINSLLTRQPQVHYHKGDAHTNRHIAVDAFTIHETIVYRKSIGGQKALPGYALDVAVPFQGRNDDPPGESVVEIIQSQRFDEIALTLIAGCSQSSTPAPAAPAAAANAQATAPITTEDRGSRRERRTRDAEAAASDELGVVTDAVLVPAVAPAKVA